MNQHQLIMWLHVMSWSELFYIPQLWISSARHEYIFTSLNAHRTWEKNNHELRNPYTNQGNSNSVRDQTYWKMGEVYFCRFFILMGSVRTSSNKCEALDSRRNRKWEPNHVLAGLHWGEIQVSIYGWKTEVSFSNRAYLVQTFKQEAFWFMLLYSRN